MRVLAHRMWVVEARKGTTMVVRRGRLVDTVLRHGHTEKENTDRDREGESLKEPSQQDRARVSRADN